MSVSQFPINTESPEIILKSLAQELGSEIEELVVFAKLKASPDTPMPYMLVLNTTNIPTLTQLQLVAQDLALKSLNGVISHGIPGSTEKADESVERESERKAPLQFARRDPSGVGPGSET